MNVATNPTTHGHAHHHHAHTAGTRTLSLALQGGGAHGAFTWGVLDRLLEEDRLAVEGISATSAGAMNAVVFAYGMALGGRGGAKTALAGFWRRVSHAARFSPLQPTAFDRMLGNHALEYSPAFMWFDLLSRLYSPYQLNPANVNPLRKALAESVDFEALRSTCCPIKLYLAATNVRTGKVKIFDNDQLCIDAVLASGCLPFLFQAVEVDSEAYWDGGYMGNPAIFPLIYGCQSADVLIVHVNPLNRPDLPKTAAEILNRINEISFNSSLMREMRAIEFVTRLVDEGEPSARQLKRVLIHAIADDELMVGLSHTSKLNADWEFLTWLRDAGRQSADTWLVANVDRVGRESSVDIRDVFL